jgi:hypothetical protein
MPARSTALNPTLQQGRDSFRRLAWADAEAQLSAADGRNPLGVQRRGAVTTVPGLYFIGLPFMYRGASSLLGGVGRDAAYLVDRLSGSPVAAPAAHGPPPHRPGR